MSRRSAAIPDDSPSTPALNFEAAMLELADLVHEMDEAQIPLETLLEKYARGKSLLSFCQTRLDEAQQRIDLISSQPDGSAALQPFTTPSTPSGNVASTDDIRFS